MIGKIIKIRKEDRVAVAHVLEQSRSSFAAAVETVRNAAEQNAKAGAFIERLYPQLRGWRYSYDKKRNQLQVLNREDDSPGEGVGG